MLFLDLYTKFDMTGHIFMFLDSLIKCTLM